SRGVICPNPCYLSEPVLYSQFVKTGHIYIRRHKYAKTLPSFDKEGQCWRKPARGGWNARGTHHPSHGLRPQHPLLKRVSSEEGSIWSSFDVVDLCRHV